VLFSYLVQKHSREDLRFARPAAATLPLLAVVPVVLRRTVLNAIRAEKYDVSVPLR
jgi:hypothetical protein